MLGLQRAVVRAKHPEQPRVYVQNGCSGKVALGVGRWSALLPVRLGLTGRTSGAANLVAYARRDRYIEPQTHPVSCNSFKSSTLHRCFCYASRFLHVSEVLVVGIACTQQSAFLVTIHHLKPYSNALQGRRGCV